MDAWFLFTFNMTMKISFPVIDFSCSIGKRKEERVTVETSKYSKFGKQKNAFHDDGAS